MTSRGPDLWPSAKNPIHDNEKGFDRLRINYIQYLWHIGKLTRKSYKLLVNDIGTRTQQATAKYYYGQCKYDKLNKYSEKLDNTEGE